MPRVLDGPFEIDGGVPERARRLTGSGAPRAVELLLFGDRPHSLATAASRRFQQNGVADLPRAIPRRGDVRQRLGSGCDRDLRFPSETPGGGLLPEEALDLRGRTDENEARVDDRLSEGRVLGKEAVAGMDRVAPRALGDLDDPRGMEVALAGRRRANRIGGVGRANMQRVAVDIAVNRDRSDAEVVAGADDTERDLAAIGDEDGGQRRSPL